MADAARAADVVNAQRVKAEQVRITQEVSHAYRDRVAALATRVAGLRKQAGQRGGRAADVPAASGAATGSDEATGGDGFSIELREVATRQAIQLDELQKWVKLQGSVDNSRGSLEGGAQAH